jgi:hypothetical protein
MIINKFIIENIYDTQSKTKSSLENSREKKERRFYRNTVVTDHDRETH